MKQEFQTEFVHISSGRSYIASRILTKLEIKELQTKTVEELNNLFIYVEPLQDFN
jgi:hypothetical protein